MSVNITVNGEYMKSCPKHYLLCDQERLKKETENERRKMRIQQVRAASKDMAKRVRDNVEIEKERQMKKIDEIKAKETELWRQNMLEEKEANYKSAIFQIGTAHRAAKRENERQNHIKINTKPRASKVIGNRGPSTSKGKENNIKNANAQTEITGNFCPGSSQFKNDTLCASDSSLSDSENDTAIHEITSSSTNTPISSTSTSSSLTELPGQKYNFSERQPLKDRGKIDQKTVPPRLSHKSPPTKLDAVSKKFARSDPVVKLRDPNTVSPKKAAASKGENDDLEPKSNNKETAFKPTDTKKRFTQITDFIRQQEGGENVSNPSTIPKQVHLQKSPNKSISKSSANKRSLPTQASKHSISPSKAKSSGLLRSVSEKVTETSTSKLSAETSGRVQFYDHNNRFHKEYNQPDSVVHTHTGSTDGIEMNAMEQALLAQKLREAREDEMDKLRKKTDERCQKAVEREQVRRACEDLTAKLDALNKQRPLLPSDNRQYSSVRLGHIAAEKEAKLNTAVENILRRPAVITCPPINRHQAIPLSMPSAPVTNDLNLGSAVNDISSLNSSNSCCSILLGYVNGQTQQLADDIKKYNQNGETGKLKVDKLQDLLNRINRLRESLLNEIAKYTSSTSSDQELVQRLMNSISQFRKERESILIDNNEGDIAKREHALKKKEAILEKKLREFYKTQKTIGKKSKTGSGEKQPEAGRSERDDREHEVKHSMSRKPLEKVIETQDSNVSDQMRVDPPQRQVETGYKEKNRETSSNKHSEQQVDVGKHKEDVGKRLPREEKGQHNTRNENNISNNKPSEKSKDSAGRSSEEESDDSYDEYVRHKELIVDKKPLEIVIKVRGSKKAKKSNKLPSKSPRKLSTLIQSPIAAKTRRKLSATRSNDSSSTSYRSLPPAIHTGMDDLIVNEPLQMNRPAAVDSKRQKSNDTRVKKKGPNLNPLMAHYVQRLLGMSRSSINALGMLSSDIETPSSSIVNTTANLSSAEAEKLTSSRLENVQRFIEDNYSFINEFEESLRQSNARETSLKSAEVAWKNALKDLKKTDDSPKDSEKRSDKSASSDAEKQKSADKQKSKQQAVQVAEKKQSSDKQTTKQQAVQVDKCTQLTDNCTQRIAELSAMIDKIRQEKQKILETTFSSVSENGPNSTEYLDLPDRRNERSTSKSLELQLSRSNENLPTQSLGSAPQLEKNTVIGLSRDSGISLSRPITVQETREDSTENLQREQSSTESLSTHNKPPKPPISIARYSPQLVEDIPHELSTIFEVETPATSKLNTSINGQRTDTIAQLQDDQPMEIVYKKFPTFEEYARLNQLDMSQFDPEFSMQFEKEFNEFMQLAKEGKIADYEQFTSFNKYIAKSSTKGDKEAAEEFLESLKMTNLSFKKFPTRKEYLNKIGVSTSDLIDSQSLEYIDDSKTFYSTNSSSESLLNVEKELKQRKILTKPFRQNAPAPAPAHSSSASGRHPEMNEMSGITQLTSAVTSTDDQSINLEQDLQRMGINWHGSMMKKTMQTQALSSTSSSLEQVSPRTKRLRSKVFETSHLKESREKTTHTEEGGRQLNIREFLTRELLKRTTTSSSISFSDDSVASSILRSIIGSITSSPAAVDAGPTLERHKTSTPMASHSTSRSGRIASKSRGSGSSQLFSGESLLSSVHYTIQSGDVNKATQKDAPS